MGRPFTLEMTSAQEMRTFSSEVDISSHQENASKQKLARGPDRPHQDHVG
jgi:hypothetical protein